jgi:nucleolysin TIA-1/TIAR
MADTATSTASLPPPPVTGATPGQGGYQNGSGSHMPPPLNIPQNNNPVPSAVTSALGGDDLTSPMSGGPRRAAPEPNKRALYVGGLDPRVTEDVLKQIFETTGHVQNVKIIPDKNVSTNPDTTVSSHSFLSRLISSRGVCIYICRYDSVAIIRCTLHLHDCINLPPSVYHETNH